MRRTQYAALIIMPLISCHDISETSALAVYGIDGATVINNDFEIAWLLPELVEAAPLLG